jgi:hypothetical protein
MAGGMFDYFGVLISVILGLALTHLLYGLVRLIQMRHEVKAYWVQLVWSLTVAVYVLGIWWGMFWWKGLEDWSAEWFYFIASYSIVLFMWAAMLFPHDFAAGLDFETYFYANRRWFFGFQTAATMMDVPETLQKAVMHLRDVPKQYVLFLPTFLLISVVGLLSANRRLHAFLAVAGMAVLLGYIFLTTLARIVLHR